MQIIKKSIKLLTKAHDYATFAAEILVRADEVNLSKDEKEELLDYYLSLKEQLDFLNFDLEEFIQLVKKFENAYENNNKNDGEILCI